ncbi:MAG: AsmA family protein [Candidatus Latescibacteria bacterium]|nr:AsmA family protein [Candidatus Latescibacterota bacterium]
MPKALKFMLGIAAVLAALVVVTAVLAVILFPAGKIRALLETKASDAMGVPVTVGGIGISFAGLPAIKASDLVVGEEKDDVPPFLKAASVRIRIDLLKLLKKRVEVVSVEIGKPEIAIVTCRDGSSNLPSPQEKTGVSGAKGPPLIPFPVTLNTIVVSNGRFVMEDRETGGPRLTFDGIDLVQKVIVDRNLALVSSGKATVADIIMTTLKGNAASISGFSADFENELTGDLGAGNFTLTKGDLVVNGIPVDIGAEITGWLKTVYSAKTGELAVADVLAALPAGLIPEQDKLTARGTLSFSMTGSVDNEPAEPVIAFDGSLDIDISPLAFEGLPKQVDSMNGHIAFTKEVITIGDTSVRIGGSQADISGAVRNYAEKPVVAIASKGDIDLDDVAGAVPLPEGTAMSGRVEFTVAMNGSPDDLQSFSADGGVNLKGVEVTMPETLIHPAKIDGGIALKPEHVSFERVKLVTGSSDLTLQGVLTNYMTLAGLGDEPASFRGTVSSRMLDMNDMFVTKETVKTKPVKPWDFEETLATMPIPANLSSSLTVNLGTVVFGRLKTSAAKGKVTLAGGALDLSDMSVSAYAGTLTGGANMNFADPGKVTYGGDFKLRALDSAQFIADLLGVGDIFRGKLSSSLSFTGAGLDSVSMLNNLKMSGDMLLEKGAIVNFGFAKKLGEQLKFLDFDSIEFDRIVNSFRVGDRKFFTPDMAITTTFGNVMVDGFVGFDTQVDYTITLDLDKETSKKALNALSGFTKYIENPPERLELTVNAGGTLTSPSFSLDTSAAEELLKANLKNRLSKEVDKLLDSKDADELKEKGRKLLNNLFKR